MTTAGNVGWNDEIILRKQAELAKVSRSEADLIASRRASTPISTERKVASNDPASEDLRRIAKVAESCKIIEPKTATIDDVGKVMAKARIEKKITQKDLSAIVHEKPSVINDYEAGRATPNQQVLGKIERALGVRLRGKDIGAPLTFGKNKIQSWGIKTWGIEYGKLWVDVLAFKLNELNCVKYRRLDED
ncbi:multiprotein-bridging factor 1 [Mortierella sp. AD032]|nr:multiprotein-bridging factor 1 [Mortierella sp. AD032]